MIALKVNGINICSTKNHNNLCVFTDKQPLQMAHYTGVNRDTALATENNTSFYINTTLNLEYLFLTYFQKKLQVRFSTLDEGNIKFKPGR